MNDKVGIWIDHKKAVIVFASANGMAARTLESQVGPHPHFGGSQEGGGEKKYEERFDHELDHYYDDVISQLGHPDSILIFGPGEAKVQLQERVRRDKALSGSRVEIETADRLTDPQIVAKVKQHYGTEL